MSEAATLDISMQVSMKSSKLMSNIVAFRRRKIAKRRNFLRDFKNAGMILEFFYYR